jgi:hypothetical protein
MDKINELISEPMGDDDLKVYFPDAKIIKYSDLENYETIEDLLPSDKSFCFLLYEQSPRVGHWCLVARYNFANKDFVEYFDSYGNRPDDPLNWNDKKTNEMLDQDEKYLTKLLKKTKSEVIYNNVPYQEYSINTDIASCGRHCCLRNLFIQSQDVPPILTFYYDFISELSKKTDLTYDELVSNFINKSKNKK